MMLMPIEQVARLRSAWQDLTVSEMVLAAGPPDERTSPPMAGSWTAIIDLLWLWSSASNGCPCWS